ncbi:hypothetical protein BJP36_15995 [Moorena producens JHB]|uniref:Uncharacterized protein n=1 Tax=Moorena producens (strain JHB) TaxID=1454205 RepID=A0A1D9G177_MOOP1|nr:hypothetical protein [Moorena producens]AOY81180.1 hypothetical protein BJP36_15995 [Moorena producens JHB]
MFYNNNKVNNNKVNNLALSAVGESVIHKIASAIKQESWLFAFLNIAWTAGPVTFLGLYGGHYLGYGNPPSVGNFVYFTAYTMIAGLLAIVVRIGKQAFYTPRVKEAEWQLLTVIDQLFELYFAARNTYIKSYPPEEQALVGAWWILRNGAASEDLLEEATFDITQDDVIARTMKRIESYRKQGIYCLIEKEYQALGDRLDQKLGHLQNNFPGIAELVKQRLQGKAPSVREGLKRPIGFLERTLTAANQESLDTMTFNDSLGIFTLTIELLSGRVILVLDPVFKGRNDLKKAKEAFDSLLSDFQLTRRMRNSRIYGLIAHLNRSDNQATHSVLGITRSQLEQLLITTLKSYLTSTPHASPQKIKKRYDDIIRLNKRLNSLHKKLLKVEQDYHKLWSSYGQGLKLVSPHNKKLKNPALILKDKTIFMRDKDKVSLAKDITNLLQDFLESKHTSPLKALLHHQQLDLSDYKKLSIELVNLLDHYLNISEPEEQIAIENSFEANLGGIEVGLAATTKAGLAALLVEEVQQARTQTVHCLVKRLIGYFNITLDDDIIDYLVRNYQADEDYLRSLEHKPEEDLPLGTISMLQQDLLSLPTWDKLKQRYSY